MRKFSIRVSILVLFSSLMILTGVCIISLNYYVGYNGLVKSSTNLLSAQSEKIELQVTNFLQSIQAAVLFNSNIIRENLLSTNNEDEMRHRFFQTTKDYPNLLGEIFSDPEGNFFYFEKLSDGTFNFHTNEGTKEKVVKLDKNGDFTGTSYYLPEKLYPPTRSWFMAAVKNKKNILSDPFIYFYNKATVIVLAGNPIYKKTDGSLLGVLGFPIMLSHISDFIATLKLTQNTEILIIDDKDNVIAAKELQHFAGSQLPKIPDIEFSRTWISKAINLYKVSKKEIFFFDSNNQKYLAYFKSLPVSIDSQWNIAIILPFSDLTGGLTKNLIISMLIAVLILIFGVFLAWIASKAISKPIVNLANRVDFIKNLEFKESVVPNAGSGTNIKEIHHMENSFAAMEQSIKSFVRYIPFSLAKILISSGKVAEVGGEYKRITLMFTDIYDFTLLSEDMHPRKLTSFLSEYFEAMTKVVLANSGTLDNYIGDGIMAFWGAPLNDEDHALHACRSALLMLEALSELNKNWQVANKPNVSIRIGINTGDVVVGNIGSEEKLSYTAIGDSVNVSNRLQDLNKVYGTIILVGQMTYELIKDSKDLAFRFIDFTAVRGKHEFIRVYELLAGTHPLREQLEKYNIDFKDAFDAYQKGNWSQAITLFEQMQQKYPEGETVLSVFLKRCVMFKNNPPEHWDGIWHAN